MGKNV